MCNKMKINSFFSHKIDSLQYEVLTTFFFFIAFGICEGKPGFGSFITKVTTIAKVNSPTITTVLSDEKIEIKKSVVKSFTNLEPDGRKNSVHMK